MLKLFWVGVSDATNPCPKQLEHGDKSTLSLHNSIIAKNFNIQKKVLKAPLAIFCLCLQGIFLTSEVVCSVHCEIVFLVVNAAIPYIHIDIIDRTSPHIYHAR